MKSNQSWGMALIVAGMLGLIAVPLSGYFVSALVFIVILGGGYLISKFYIIKDNDKEKEK